jgi:hypothetical protein
VFMCVCVYTRNSLWARQYVGNYDGTKWLFNFFARSLCVDIDNDVCVCVFVCV